MKRDYKRGKITLHNRARADLSFALGLNGFFRDAPPEELQTLYALATGGKTNAPGIVLDLQEAGLLTNRGDLRKDVSDVFLSGYKLTSNKYEDPFAPADEDERLRLEQARQAEEDNRIAFAERLLKAPGGPGGPSP